MTGQKPIAKEEFEKTLADPGVSDPQSDQADRTWDRRMHTLPDPERGSGGRAMTGHRMSAAQVLLREHVARAHAQIEQLEAGHDGPGWSGDEPEPDEPEAGA